MEDNEKTYTQEEVEKMINDLKEENEKNYDKKFNKAWAKEKSKIERENAKKDEFIKLVMEQTKAENFDELLSKSYEQYGVDRPVDTISDEEWSYLGTRDAKNFMEVNDYNEIAEETERLSHISDRTPRQQAMFMELANNLKGMKTELKRKNEIKEAGLDESILDDKFKEFLGKFNESVNTADAYAMYQKMNPKKEPFNTGSLKDTKATNEEAYFTKDEFMALTDEDLKNPVIYKKAMESKNFF